MRGEPTHFEPLRLDVLYPRHTPRKELKLRKAVFALALCASPVAAHDFHDMTVTSVTDKGRFVAVLLSETVRGQTVSCAAYGADGGIVAQESWITENLATTVLIRTPAADVASVRCVLSE
jgi:hypothetical protein